MKVAGDSPHAVGVEPPGPRLLGQALRGLSGRVGGAVRPPA